MKRVWLYFLVCYKNSLYIRLQTFLALFKIVDISCSLFGYITLHMLMYAANTYFWRRYRINYPFLFGIRPGTELDHREVFLLTTGHAVVAVLCFLINLQLEMNQPNRSYKTAAELVPLSLIVVRFVIWNITSQETLSYIYIFKNTITSSLVFTPHHNGQGHFKLIH